MAEDRVAPAASPVTVLVAEVQDHSAGRPSLRESLIRFCVTGVASVCTDFAVLYGLHSGAGVSLTLATVLGLTAAVVVNYALNRNWTFQARASHGNTLGPYLLLVVVNLGTTLVIVRGLTHLGLYYLLSKGVAVVFNAILNFTSSRYWIFKH
ncbi:MAG TPA: GtrA family protein [Mycobacteriales bacterium]|nr:GtrA family protein [Mycobacteriales bacterium]HWC34231.1 GtrA family protein [Mycobacteriales bacterium]